MQTPTIEQTRATILSGNKNTTASPASSEAPYALALRRYDIVVNIMGIFKAMEIIPSARVDELSATGRSELPIDKSGAC